MGNKKNKPVIVLSIRYLENDDLMHQWGALVYLLEHFYGAMAIPRYKTTLVAPGICENEVETNASVDDIKKVIRSLMSAKYSGVFPELVDIIIKEES